MRGPLPLALLQAATCSGFLHLALHAGRHSGCRPRVSPTTEFSAAFIYELGPQAAALPRLTLSKRARRHYQRKRADYKKFGHKLSPCERPTKANRWLVGGDDWPSG